jgi:hypothetical protein
MDGETAQQFNAAQPKVPAGRAPFLHGEDAEKLCKPGLRFR